MPDNDAQQRCPTFADSSTVRLDMPVAFAANLVASRGEP